MRTAQQWWADMKASPELFNAWLMRQYIGEVTAASRINALLEKFGEQTTPAGRRQLHFIAYQETQHAQWISELLAFRSITMADVSQVEAETRYWAKTMGGIEDFITGCAVAAHAEKMRLMRIEVIANDPEAPPDVRAVFQKILPDEMFHERAFRTLTTPEALEKTQGNHEQGMEALGLVV